MSGRADCCRKASLVFVLLALAIWSWPASAQVNVDTNTIFELDGNPQDPASPTGEDWHHYFNVLHPAPPFPAGNATTETFAAETGNVTIFTQGGSKDINGVSQWRHTS